MKKSIIATLVALAMVTMTACGSEPLTLMSTVPSPVEKAAVEKVAKVAQEAVEALPSGEEVDEKLVTYGGMQEYEYDDAAEEVSVSDKDVAGNKSSLPEETVEQVIEETPVVEKDAPKGEPIAWVSIGHEDICLYPAEQENSNINARIACNYLNGVTVAPGATFSYSNALGGDTTPDKGYVQSNVISGGNNAVGYGGGVCKISSCLYQAACHANLTIVERHPHSHNVGYYDQQHDAAIAYPYKDLRFKNNTGDTIMISATYDDAGFHMDILAPQY